MIGVTLLKQPHTENRGEKGESVVWDDRDGQEETVTPCCV